MKILIMVLLGVSLLFGAIDINSASKKELIVLNGIGAKKAELIIAHRDANCFKNIDELILVKGIGKKIINKNRNNLIANNCKR